MAVNVIVSANSSAFVSAMKSAQLSAKNLEATVLSVASSLSKVLAGAIVGVAGASAFGINKVLDLGGSLSDMSQQTGIAVGELMLLQKAFIDGGLGAESVGKSINKMQKAISEADDGSVGLTDQFKALGLSVEDLKTLSPSQQFKAIGDALAAIQDPARRTQAAMAVFGKSGAEMMAIFRNPKALEEAARSLGGQAEIFQRNAAAFDRASDILNGLYLKIQGFFAGVADKIIPGLLMLLEALDGIDLSKIGQEFGNSIMSAAQILYSAFQADRLGELIRLGVTYGFQKAVEGLVSMMKFAIDLISNLFAEIFNGATTNIATNFVTALGSAIVSIGSLITAVLLEAFETPIRYFQAGIQKIAQEFMELVASVSGSSMTGIKYGFKAESFKDILDNTDATLAGFDSKDFANQAKTFGDMAKKAILEGGERFSNLISRTKFENVDLFGDEIGSTLSTLISDLQLFNQIAKPKEFDTIDDSDKFGGGKLSSFLFQGPIASSLAKIGGGGNFAAGGLVRDPDKKMQIDEAKKTNTLLKDIKEIFKNPGSGQDFALQ